jgi:hypothetical protein
MMKREFMARISRNAKTTKLNNSVAPGDLPKVPQTCGKVIADNLKP